MIAKKQFHLGSNYVNRFSIGWESGPANFFLAGLFLDSEPVISCRIFGTDGGKQFELQSNSLSRDSSSLYRRIGFQRGWRVCDEFNRDLLEIIIDGELVRINGEFFDNTGQLVATGNSNGLLLIKCPLNYIG